MNYVAIDIETAGLTPDAALHCIGVASEYETKVFTKPQQFINYMTQLGWPIPVFHNALFDKPRLERRGLCPQGGYSDWEDTMLMAYLLMPGSDVKLETQAKKIGREKLPKPVSFDKFTKQMATYCARDAFVTLELFFELEGKMSDELFNYYKTVELPYQLIIEDIELGYYINEAKLSEVRTHQEELNRQASVEFLSYFNTKVKVKKEVLLPKNKQNCKEPILVFENGSAMPSSVVWHHRDKERSRYDTQACEYSYCTFEYLRATHKKEIIQQLLLDGWKPEEFSEKTEEPTLDKSVLESIAGRYPLARAARRYAKLTREITSYLDKIQEAPTVSDGISLLTASVNQAVTSTTRLSISEPPLQQIPVRDPDSRYIRSLFIPPPGYSLIIGDVSQFELRILAFYLEVLCEDRRLADIIRDGRDVHSENAAAWFGKNFTKEQRSTAKNSIFAVLYGAGMNKLSGMLGISVRDAKTLINKIYETTAIEEYEEIMVDQAMSNGGYLQGIAGNRWYIHELFMSTPALVALGKRLCRNYPIQGTQAALMKHMQNKADAACLDAGLIKYMKADCDNFQYCHPVLKDYRTCLQVHDEAHIIVKHEYAQLVKTIYNRVFNNNNLLSFEGVTVPIVAEFVICENWSEKK